MNPTVVYHPLYQEIGVSDFGSDWRVHALFIILSKISKTKENDSYVIIVTWIHIILLRGEKAKD